MANMDQLERLRMSIDAGDGNIAWNHWRASHPHEAIDLNGADLSGAVLAHANLSRANLAHANLSGVDLTDADMRDAALRGCLLTGITGMGANLTQVSLHGAMIDKNTLLHNLYLAQLDWRDAPFLVTDALLQKQKTVAICRSSAQAYRELANELRSHGYVVLASGYRLRAERIERRGMRARIHLLSWLGSFMLDVVSGYGERARNTFMAYFAVVSLFSVLFFGVTNTVEVHSASVAHLTWDESLVLSLTSFHGRGFFPGYLQLDDWVARLGAIEAAIGLFIELTLIATFSRRFLGS